MTIDKIKIGIALAKQIEDENKPYKHVSTLDMISIGYEFKMGRDSNMDYYLEEVVHCGKPMSLEVFLKQLFFLGIDTDSGVYVEAVLHRPAQTNSPTYGFRFGGLERLDKAWVNSPFVSYEARIVSSGMSDMWSTVKSMSGTPSDKVAERFYESKKDRNKSKYKNKLGD